MISQLLNTISRDLFIIHKADNCLIMKNASFGNESRLQQMQSETGREDASYKLKGFTEKVIQDNSIKYNMSLCKKADKEVIRIRGKDLQEKEDM